MQCFRGFAAVALLAGMQCAVAQPTLEIFHPDPRYGGNFADVELQIQSKNCRNWENCEVSAHGTYKGKPVAIRVITKRDLQRNLIIEYHSVGSESDNLLSSLAQIYKIKTHSAEFKPAVVAYIVPLIVTDTDMKNKVFFSANGPESDYAELYTNIDIKLGLLHIREKDESYRENVIKAFSR